MSDRPLSEEEASTREPCRLAKPSLHWPRAGGVKAAFQPLLSGALDRQRQPPSTLGCCACPAASVVEKASSSAPRRSLLVDSSE